MNPTKKAKTKPAAENWRSPGSPDDLSPVERMAHAIITERSDLFPSVERIMTAPLNPDGRLQALTLFRESLHNPGDTNRDPRVAISRCLPTSDAP
jgi:hypothetical protein